MFNIIGKRKYWFGISVILVIISFIALWQWGLNWGIDFTGGSLMEVSIDDNAISNENIAQTLTTAGYNGVQVQPSTDNLVLIRLESLTEEQHQAVLQTLEENFHQVDEDGNIISQIQEERFESIGPTIGAELKSKALSAIIWVLLAIVAYIAFAFRKVSYPVASWKYGISAIIALAHDIFITIGLFSILGHYLGYQIDSLFVTALLTIMGFSVHDTIVTFDRTRENLFRHQNQTFSDIVNNSINETLVRSLNTSLTTMIVLLAVYLFGGASIQHFILALLFGIVIGTYSSIFLASPLLLVWYKGWKKQP
ncbi:MAG: protein translocase subunit SecF [Candidatus Komeilibacteria bacterium]